MLGTVTSPVTGSSWILICPVLPVCHGPLCYTRDESLSEKKNVRSASPYPPPPQYIYFLFYAYLLDWSRMAPEFREKNCTLPSKCGFFSHCRLTSANMKGHEILQSMTFKNDYYTFRLNRNLHRTCIWVSNTHHFHLLRLNQLTPYLAQLLLSVDKEILVWQ